jgi:uncharacterized protein YbjT (DUF2867 family)
MDNIIKDFTTDPGNSLTPVNKTIILAGATGDLGQRIAGYLVQSGATLKALVRNTTSPSISSLEKLGVQITEVDFNNHVQLLKACSGGACFVSAVSGLREVIVDLQTKLLQAAVEAGIPRFIPSDFSIDYTKLSPGSNRNLDLRREFNERLDTAPIAATSILNGMFMDLLTGQAPVILTGIKRIMFWGNANQPLDFTTIDNTAKYTAAVAIDTATPRYLRIAGEVASPHELQKIASEVTGHPFKLLRPGGLSAFKTMIAITRFVAPQKKEVFPAWQGMQYLHNMFTGLPKLHPLDNARYPGIHWTGVRELLEKDRKMN